MMLVIVFKLIMICGIVLFVELGIKTIEEANEEIKEYKRILEERRKHMLSVLEQERKHENGADIPHKSTIIPDKGVIITDKGAIILPNEIEYEKWDGPNGRIIQLAFFAKKKRIKKKNLKRMGEYYGRIQEREISGDR